MREEVVFGPYTVWLAPTGTTFPAIDAAPAGDWTKLGTNGTENYQDTVIVEHNQTIVEFVPAGSTAPIKASRTTEAQLVRFNLVDLSPAQYAKTLNDAAITTTPAGVGVAGTKKFNLLRGTHVTLYALLARGISPVDEALAAQYEVPIVYNNGQPKPAFGKAAPGALECIFTALKDATLGFGKLNVQTAAATA